MRYFSYASQSHLWWLQDVMSGITAAVLTREATTLRMSVEDRKYLVLRDNTGALS